MFENIFRKKSPEKLRLGEIDRRVREVRKRLKRMEEEEKKIKAEGFKVEDYAGSYSDEVKNLIFLRKGLEAGIGRSGKNLHPTKEELLGGIRAVIEEAQKELSELLIEEGEIKKDPFYFH